MVRPTQLSAVRPLTSGEISTGTFDPDNNGDWPTGPIGSTPTLTVKESDATPTVTLVGTLIFDSAVFTVTDGGDGSATVSGSSSTPLVWVLATAYDPVIGAWLPVVDGSGNAVMVEV